MHEPMTPQQYREHLLSFEVGDRVRCIQTGKTGEIAHMVNGPEPVGVIWDGTFVFARPDMADVEHMPKLPSIPERIKSIGFALGFIPFSWGFGPWVRPHKISVALGPFRLFIYRHLKDWKSYDGAPRH